MKKILKIKPTWNKKFKCNKCINNAKKYFVIENTVIELCNNCLKLYKPELKQWFDFEDKQSELGDYID